jgi:NADH:ubiquinone oxidoreductase subunit F (NADH-binding)
MSEPAAVLEPDPAGARGTLPRLLTGVRTDGGPLSLDLHVRLHGSLAMFSRAGLIELVAASGLRGRGGAAFPTARKLEAVAAGRGRPVVVANGTEGEPASDKDKALLRWVPHLVLDGVSLAAAAVGAAEAIVVIGEGSRNERAVMDQALAERDARALDRDVRISLAAAPDRFVAGEETALINFLNGGPAKPLFVPPRPFERGVGGAPTLVQNVETLAHLALIARYGAEWFRELGSDDEPGSALVTLSGGVRRPGVYEVGLGTAFRDIVVGAGGLSEPATALLVGGYFGGWIEARSALELSLLDADLAPHGIGLGARAVAVLPQGACGVVETARVARYLANESAGQCGPCVNGLDAIATSLERIAAGRADRSPEQILRWTSQVLGRGACKHPDGAVRFVESGLQVFSREFELHGHGRRCSGDGRTVLPVEVSR